MTGRCPLTGKKTFIDAVTAALQDTSFLAVSPRKLLSWRAAVTASTNVLLPVRGHLPVTLFRLASAFVRSAVSDRLSVASSEISRSAIASVVALTPLPGPRPPELCKRPARTSAL